MEPTSPEKKSSKDLETPQKNRIRGAVEFAEFLGVKYTKIQLATKFKATRQQVDYALKSDADSRSDFKFYTTGLASGDQFGEGLLPLNLSHLNKLATRVNTIPQSLRH